MQTLTWKDGTCTNAPDGWSVSVSVDYGRGWKWWARFIDNRATRDLAERDFSTERAAQLACEAALIRLGVVPLTEAIVDQVLSIEERYVDSDHADTEWWWCVGEIQPPHYTVLEGTAANQAAATAAAERHLRAELAAWLDAEAAKEGAK